MSKRNKILVTGPPRIGTFDVVEGIFTSSNQPLPQHLKPTDKTEAVAGLIIPWEIDNKYYTANVDFWLDEPEVETRKETIQEFTRKENGVVDVIDAFIYVFKKDEINGFEGIKEWVEFLNQCEPAIKICIALSSSTTTIDSNDNEKRGKEEEKMEEWCLDHQFDYVDMDLQSESSLDKVGYDMVVDALHTNMWDGLTRKDGRQAKKINILQSRGDGEDDVDDEDFDIKDLDDLKNEDWYKEIEKLKLNDKKSIDIEGENYGEDILEFEDGDDLDELDLPSKEEIEKMHKQLFSDIDQEDGLDKAFQSLQAMREKSKDLPDEERRRMAAQVALSFAAQLGL